MQSSRYFNLSPLNSVIIAQLCFKVYLQIDTYCHCARMSKPNSLIYIYFCINLMHRESIALYARVHFACNFRPMWWIVCYPYEIYPPIWIWYLKSLPVCSILSTKSNIYLWNEFDKVLIINSCEFHSKRQQVIKYK